ncbi:hypothetical protein Zmor_007224 [Zophobas morio]|uniref:Peptidase C1A papain C-terminal domain-containing protein n=1 Tax=Zophobas morio TaxID=2755281 RepID=A0AA38IRB2_9CUCU|nr:hypothetical protein Zmor_007224 [Zophobas morio]
MKVFVLCITLVAAISATPAEINTLSFDFIESINQKQSSWVAGRNFPENTTNEYLYQLNGVLGIHPDPNYQPVRKTHEVNLQDIPQFFDARQQWPYCDSLNRIRDQGGCGSCWAFAAVESMSDRICIHSSGSAQFMFSAEDLLSCCGSCGSCDGGYVTSGFDYYINTGLVSGGDLNSNEGCRPYTADAHDYGQTPACVQSCNDGYPVGYDADKHYGNTYYYINNAIDQMQYDIMTNGPITVTYNVCQDFYNYQSGVYYYVSGDYAGYHAVKILGWGDENGIPYWLVANSWGNGWGDNGFFKIRRGNNECGIEDYPYAGLPNL